MVVVHGGDEDGVDIFAIEDAAIVAGGGDAGVLDGFLRCGVAAVVEVTNRDALDAGNAERSFEVFASANAGADGSETDGIAGSDGTRRGGKQMRLQDIFGDRGGGKSAGAEMNELTAGQGIFGHEILRLLNFRAWISASATSELPGRNYPTGGGELVKRFSSEGGEVAIQASPALPLQRRETSLHLFILGVNEVAVERANRRRKLMTFAPSGSVTSLHSGSQP